MSGNRYLYQELLDQAMMMSQPLYLKLQALKELEQNVKLQQIKNNIREALLHIGFQDSLPPINSISDIEIVFETLKNFLRNKHNEYINAVSHTDKTKNIQEAEEKFYEAYQVYQQAIKHIELSVTHLLAYTDRSSIPPDQTKQVRKFRQQAAFATRILLTDFNAKISPLQQAENLLERILITQPHFDSKEAQGLKEVTHKKYIDALQAKISQAKIAKTPEEKEKSTAELHQATQDAFVAVLMATFPDNGTSLAQFAETDPHLLVLAEKEAKTAEEKLSAAQENLAANEAEIKALTARHQELMQKEQHELKKHKEKLESKLQEFRTEAEPHRLKYIADKIAARGQEQKQKIEQEIEQVIMANIHKITSAANEKEKTIQQEFAAQRQQLEKEIAEKNSSLDHQRRLTRSLQKSAQEKAAELTKIRPQVEKELDKWKRINNKTVKQATTETKSKPPQKAYLLKIADLIIADASRSKLKNLIANPIKNKLSIILRELALDSNLKPLKPYFQSLLAAYERREEIIKNALQKSKAINASDLKQAIYDILEYQDIFATVVAHYAVRIEKMEHLPVGWLQGAELEKHQEYPLLKEYFRKKADPIIGDQNRLQAFIRTNRNHPIKIKFTAICESVEFDDKLMKQYIEKLDEYDAQLNIISNPKQPKDALRQAVSTILEYQQFFADVIADHESHVDKLKSHKWIAAEIVTTLQAKLSSLDLKSQVAFLSAQLSHIRRQTERKGSDPLDLNTCFNQLSEMKSADPVAAKQFNEAYNQACNQIVLYHVNIYKESGKLPKFEEQLLGELSLTRRKSSGAIAEWFKSTFRKLTSDGKDKDKDKDKDKEKEKEKEKEKSTLRRSKSADKDLSRLPQSASMRGVNPITLNRQKLTLKRSASASETVRDIDDDSDSDSESPGKDLKHS